MHEGFQKFVILKFSRILPAGDIYPSYELASFIAMGVTCQHLRAVAAREGCLSCVNL